jgi:hypothetical protein
MLQLDPAEHGQSSVHQECTSIEISAFAHPKQSRLAAQGVTPLKPFLMCAPCLDLRRVLRSVHLPVRVVCAGFHRLLRSVFTLQHVEICPLAFPLLRATGRLCRAGSS